MTTSTTGVDGSADKKAAPRGLINFEWDPEKEFRTSRSVNKVLRKLIAPKKSKRSAA
jgi:hypothetical protein